LTGINRKGPRDRSALPRSAALEQQALQRAAEPTVLVVEVALGQTDALRLEPRLRIEAHPRPGARTAARHPPSLAFGSLRGSLAGEA
jgi:hypothetical protein